MAYAMIKISVEQARIILSENWNREVYQLHDDGSESLVTDEFEIEDDCAYGIEGELFGEPYGEEDE